MMKPLVTPFNDLFGTGQFKYLSQITLPVATSKWWDTLPLNHYLLWFWQKCLFCSLWWTFILTASSLHSHSNSCIQPCTWISKKSPAQPVTARLSQWQLSCAIRQEKKALREDKSIEWCQTNALLKTSLSCSEVEVGLGIKPASN